MTWGTTAGCKLYGTGGNCPNGYSYYSQAEGPGAFTPDCAAQEPFSEVMTSSGGAGLCQTASGGEPNMCVMWGVSDVSACEAECAATSCTALAFGMTWGTTA